MNRCNYYRSETDFGHVVFRIQTEWVPCVGKKARADARRKPQDQRAEEAKAHKARQGPPKKRGGADGSKGGW